MRAASGFVPPTLAAAAAVQKSDLNVVTSNGKITGHLATGMRNTVECLGIPYAATRWSTWIRGVVAFGGKD